MLYSAAQADDASATFTSCRFTSSKYAPRLPSSSSCVPCSTIWPWLITKIMSASCTDSQYSINPVRAATRLDGAEAVRHHHRRLLPARVHDLVQSLLDLLLRPLVQRARRLRSV